MLPSIKVNPTMFEELKNESVRFLYLTWSLPLSYVLVDNGGPYKPQAYGFHNPVRDCM